MSNSILLFTSPISRPSFDGGTSISGMKIISYSVDVDTLIGTATVRAIEDLPAVGSTHTFTIGPFTGSTTFAQQLAALKTAASALLGVTFQ